MSPHADIDISPWTLVTFVNAVSSYKNVETLPPAAQWILDVCVQSVKGRRTSGIGGRMWRRERQNRSQPIKR